MAIVHERLTASKAPMLPTPGADAKTAQRANSVTQLPNSSATINKDLLEPQGDGIGFFGSFFQKKKKPGVLENVSCLFESRSFLMCLASSCPESHWKLVRARIHGDGSD